MSISDNQTDKPESTSRVEPATMTRKQPARSRKTSRGKMDHCKQPSRKRVRFEKERAAQNTRGYAKDHCEDDLSSSDDDSSKEGLVQYWLAKQAKPKPEDRIFYGISEEDWKAAGPSKQRTPSLQEQRERVVPASSIRVCVERIDEFPWTMTNALGGLDIRGSPASPASPRPGLGAQER